MKYKLLLFLSIFLFAINSDAQITFQKAIGFPVIFGGAFSARQTNDGGYIIAGEVEFTDSDSSIPAIVYLIKTNNEGDTVWTKIFGIKNGAYGYSALQTADGGYIVEGLTVGDSANSETYVIKTNSIGDALWTKVYNELYPGTSIQQTYDGGYIMTGIQDSFFEVPGYAALLKIDDSGNIQWNKTYGGGYGERGGCVKQTSDSGYIVCGSTSSFGAGVSDIYLIKTNAKGDTLWTKAYGGSGDDEGEWVQQTNDGGYIITGLTGSFGDSSYNSVYLIKTDTKGDTLWTKIYGEYADDAYGWQVQQTTDSGYIITGFISELDGGINDIYLIKTNASGDTLWTKTYLNFLLTNGYSIEQTKDNGYIVAGSIVTGSSTSVYLIKTDANGNSGECNIDTIQIIVGSTATQVTGTQTIVSPGNIVATSVAAVVSSGGTANTLCSSTGIVEEISNNTMSIYPSPTTDQLMVTGNWQENKTMNLTIFNILGEAIYTNEINSKQQTVNCKSFSSGIYFVHVTNETGSWVGKFVKE